MTIRYTCEECNSVLKIRDQLAGTRAQCPKCETDFQIPAATSRQKKTIKKRKSKSAPTESLDDLVDMPREITPTVTMSNSDEFDPLDVLFDSPGESAKTLGSSRDSVEAPKPSVAELMREHEAKKKKQKKSYSKGKKNTVADAVAATNAFTSGSASDAIARTYDQKRSKASDAPPLTRDERREAEYRAAVKEFGIKAITAVGTALLLGGMLIFWALSESVPDLVAVTGVVTQQNRPLSGVSVQFAPHSAKREDELENATPSSGYTGPEGKFVMMYDLHNAGVLPGTHDISISTPTGIVFRLPQQDQQKTIELGEDYDFTFNIN